MAGPELFAITELDCISILQTFPADNLRKRDRRGHRATSGEGLRLHRQLHGSKKDVQWCLRQRQEVLGHPCQRSQFEDFVVGDFDG